MKQIILISCLIALALAQKPTCPPDQEYTECGTACPETCRNRGIAISCIAMCKIGCVCKKGLVLDDAGNCIDPKKCPATTPVTAPPLPPPAPTRPCKQSDCGTACEPTCENPEPKFCTEQCVKGCFCESGYVKDAAGRCILQKDCPVKPPPSGTCTMPFQQFLECGSSCEPTCDNPNPTVCNKRCVKGCFCLPGYLKNSRGDCIKPLDCPNATKPPVSVTLPPPRCPHNQIYKDCGVPASCEITCKNKDANLAKCMAMCTAGCYCPDGLIKNDQGICVHPDECSAPPVSVTLPPPRCPRNQIYKDCGVPAGCEITCKNKDVKIKCAFVCTAGCYCPDGLLKDDQGNCVPYEKCPATGSTTRRPGQCGPHQKFNTCGTACEPSCKTPKPEICTMQCVAGCFCESPYVKTDKGDCVLQKDCPKQNPPQKCPQNETWSSDCVAPRQCQGPYCPNARDQKMCRIKCPNDGGCICRPGFLRDDNHNCVLIRDCPRSRPGSPRTSVGRD